MCRKNQSGISSWQGRFEARLSREWLLGHDHPKKTCRSRLSVAQSFDVLLLTRSCGGGFVFPVVDDRPVSSFRGRGSGGWTQRQSSEMLLGYSMAAIVAMSCWKWVSTNCEDFREMNFVKYAMYVGTMIGPEGYLHRWKGTAGEVHPKNKENKWNLQEPRGATG